MARPEQRMERKERKDENLERPESERKGGGDVERNTEPRVERAEGDIDTEKEPGRRRGKEVEVEQEEE